MKPAPFEYHPAETVEEAVALLSEYGDEAKVLAGGQSLVPILALRLARFDHLIDVNRVAGLDEVTFDQDSLRVGATCRHRLLERSPQVAASAPLLSLATRKVGHFQIRNRGTIGGAMAHADPAAEQPAVALAMDAVIEAKSERGRRDIPAREFFQGTWTTALAADELLTAVHFPIWTGRCGFAVEELARRSGDFALAGVVCATAMEDGKVERMAIALFGVGGTPVRASAAEAVMTSGGSPQEMVDALMAEIDPPDDLHASSQYRKKIAGVLARRAVERACQEAMHG